MDRSNRAPGAYIYNVDLSGEPGRGPRRLPSAMLTHVVPFALKLDAAPAIGERFVHDARHANRVHPIHRGYRAVLKANVARTQADAFVN